MSKKKKQYISFVSERDGIERHGHEASTSSKPPADPPRGVLGAGAISGSGIWMSS